MVVGVVLTSAAVELVQAQRRSLESSIRSSARSQAARAASLLRSGAPTQELLSSGGDYPVQVVDGSGSVVAASAGLRGAPALADGRGSRGHQGIVVTRIGGLPSGTDGPYLVVSTATVGPQGPRTVHVVASLRSTRLLMRTGAIGLGAGLPVLVVLVGATAWVLAGSTLKPVEAIRGEVAEISRRALRRRVPEPPSSDEVARLARTMNELLDRLEASAARQRRFVADASHELRSPLTAIQAQLDVALARPERSDWPAVAAEIAQETRRMRRIVDDLLLMARADGEAVAPRFEPVDLDELVLAEARRLRDRGEVQVDLSHMSAARVSGDRDQLTQVVRNLVTNAERHASSAVRLELGMVGDEAELVVADDGPGIPPGDRERVFERFTRLDEARSRSRGGVGLGLAIARRIVEAHGGTITVGDHGDGARLVVRLPAGPGA